MQRLGVSGKYNSKKNLRKNKQSVKVKRKLKKSDICSYQDKEAKIPFLSTCAR